MTNCKHCGTKQDENNAHCEQCGFSIDDQPSTEHNPLDLNDANLQKTSNSSENDEMADVKIYQKSDFSDFQGPESGAHIVQDESLDDAKDGVNVKNEGSSEVQNSIKEREESRKDEAQREKIEAQKEKLKRELEDRGEKVGTFFSNYAAYFLDTLKSPIHSFDYRGQLYGYVNIALLILFSAFPLMIFVNRLNQLFQNTFILFNDFLRGMTDEIAGSINFRIFIFFVLTYAVLFGIGFLITRFTTNTEEDINTISTQFAGLLSSGVLLVALATILAFFVPMDMFILVVALITLPALMFLFALNFYLYERATRIHIDKYYLLFLTNIIIVLAIALLYKFLLHSYFANIFDNLGQFGGLSS